MGAGQLTAQAVDNRIRRVAMALPTMGELTIVSVTALVQNRQPQNTPVFCPCPGGEIGRRRGFKIPR